MQRPVGSGGLIDLHDGSTGCLGYGDDGGERDRGRGRGGHGDFDGGVHGCGGMDRRRDGYEGDVGEEKNEE